MSKIVTACTYKVPGTWFCAHIIIELLLRFTEGIILYVQPKYSHGIGRFLK